MCCLLSWGRGGKSTGTLWYAVRIEPAPLLIRVTRPRHYQKAALTLQHAWALFWLVAH